VKVRKRKNRNVIRDLPGSSGIPFSDHSRDFRVSSRLLGIAAFGWEATAGLSIADIPFVVFGRYMVQIPGTALRIDARHPARGSRCVLWDPSHDSEMHRNAGGSDSPPSSLNASHNVEARYCRCIISTCDCIGRDDLPFTHGFLVEILGIQRSTVSEVIQACRKKSINRQDRGLIIVTKRKCLEATSFS
jgi:hypothetical protein